MLMRKTRAVLKCYLEISWKFDSSLVNQISRFPEDIL